jgi:hypothetical protein
MGGALAILAACRLAKAGFPPVATYTFGSPRVGDRAFCAGYRLPTYRVVHGLDLVPEMPLASMKRRLPAQIRFRNPKLALGLKRMARRVPCYGHVRTFVYIDRDGEVTIDADVEPWHAHAVARAIATRGKSFLEGVTDHLISNYIRGLEGHPSRRHPHRVRRRIPVALLLPLPPRERAGERGWAEGTRGFAKPSRLRFAAAPLPRPLGAVASSPRCSRAVASSPRCSRAVANSARSSPAYRGEGAEPNIRPAPR